MRMLNRRNLLLCFRLLSCELPVIIGSTEMGRSINLVCCSEASGMWTMTRWVCILNLAAFRPIYDNLHRLSEQQLIVSSKESMPAVMNPWRDATAG